MDNGRFYHRPPMPPRGRSFAALRMTLGGAQDDIGSAWGNKGAAGTRCGADASEHAPGISSADLAMARDRQETRDTRRVPSLLQQAFVWLARWVPAPAAITVRRLRPGGLDRLVRGARCLPISPVSLEPQQLVDKVQWPPLHLV